MKKLTEVVRVKTKIFLQGGFVVVFNGCAGPDVYYMAISRTFPADKVRRYNSVLLCVVQMGDEGSQSADEHIMLLTFVLSIFNQTLEHVVALISDIPTRITNLSGTLGPTLWDVWNVTVIDLIWPSMTSWSSKKLSLRALKSS